MLGLAAVWYRLRFGGESRDLFRLALAGGIAGTIFSSLTALLTRLIDPNEFMTLQDLRFANFSGVNQDLLLVAAAAVGATALLTRPRWGQLDTAALGRENAISLGVNHQRLVRQCLAAVAALVSVATALVGPVAFGGVLVFNLACLVTGTFRHRYTLAAAGLLAAFSLICGQFVLQEVLASEVRLSVVISLVGGSYFILLLLRESRR